MMPSRPFGQISRSCVRWLLAWIAALLVSVGLAAAISSAIVGAASDREQPDVHAGQRTGESVASALDPSLMALSGLSFDVMSNTTPASTGHASSTGCCTWD